MNKRMKKKKIRYIIDNIQKFNLNPDEFLIFRFDENNCSIAQVAQFNDYIRENISNKVIFLPKDINMFKITEKNERE